MIGSIDWRFNNLGKNLQTEEENDIQLKACLLRKQSVAEDELLVTGEGCN